jgi:hypothetical protein
VGTLWRLYAEYPYMPRLRDRRVLDAGLTSPQLLWEQDGFAFADGYDESAGRYRGLVLPSDGTSVAITNDTLLVRPERAVAQRASETAAAGPEDGTRGTDGDEDDGALPPPSPPPPLPERTRFFGSKELQADRYASDFKKVTDEVLGPLGAVDGVRLRVTVEIEAVAPEGFDESKVRTVSENATTLKFEEAGFED